MTAREEILNRIQTALGLDSIDVTTSHTQIARDYRQHTTLTAEARLELLIDRLLDYDTEIIQVDSEDQIAAAIAEALARDNETRVLAPPAFPRPWLPATVDTIIDDALDTPAIEAAQTVLTTCEVAIASTGTIVLVHHGAQGRRVLTLLPDHHICIVRRNQVVGLVSEALAVIGPHSHAPITTISGPSATSDIEMTRVRGVHGPRRLTVILYGEL